jgi:hypothetical protein
MKHIAFASALVLTVSLNAAAPISQTDRDALIKDLEQSRAVFLAAIADVTTEAQWNYKPAPDRRRDVLPEVILGGNDAGARSGRSPQCNHCVSVGADAEWPHRAAHRAVAGSEGHGGVSEEVGVSNSKCNMQNANDALFGTAM